MKVACELQFEVKRDSLNRRPRSLTDRTGQVAGLSIAECDEERCTDPRDSDLKSPDAGFPGLTSLFNRSVTAFDLQPTN
jgi:hypothetical protein